METIALKNMRLLDFGNEIALWGVVYEGLGHTLLMPFPGSDPAVAASSLRVLSLQPEEWRTFLDQVDVQNVELATKAIVRKSQRVIDQHVQWSVWRRDGFRCRYCGMERPLTVDHIDLWEDGGASVAENLLSACRPCNKTRGRMPYVDWMMCDYYLSRARHLSDEQRNANAALALSMENLKALRARHKRSR